MLQAKTPQGRAATLAYAKEDMCSWMLRHAAELERDGHHDLAEAARLNALQSPRVPLSAKTSTNVPPTSTAKSAKTTPMRDLVGLRAWLEAHPDTGEATKGAAAADESFKSPSVVGYKDEKDTDIDEPTVRQQLAALRDGMLRQLAGKNTPGLEREVVAKPAAVAAASPTDDMWRRYESGSDDDAEGEAEPLSPSMREASDAIWAMWEAEQSGLVAAEAAAAAAAGVEDALQLQLRQEHQRVAALCEAARFPRSPLTGVLLLSLYVAAAAACAALVAFPPSADASDADAAAPPAAAAAADALRRVGGGHPMPAVRACAAMGQHGPAVALAVARCAGADAVRAVLTLLRKIGRLFKGGRQGGAAKPAKPGQK